MPDYCWLTFAQCKTLRSAKNRRVSGQEVTATEIQLRIPLGAHVRYGTSLLRMLRNLSAAHQAPETYDAARKGTVTVTLVPPPGSLSNLNVPFSCSTRSRILITPSPPDFPI